MIACCDSSLAVVEEHVLPELGHVGLRLDALVIVREHEELDVAGQRQHRPRGLRQHRRRDGIGLRHERVAFGHAVCAHPLDSAEKLLVLDLLVAEAHQRLQRVLVAEPVVAAHVEHLGGDEPLDEAEYVGVGAALNLAEQSLVVRAEEGEAIDLRQTVGQEPLGEIETPAANHVAIDVPADALGHFDGLGVARGGDARCGGLLRVAVRIAVQAWKSS